jgi:hypothetical protein
MRTNSSETVLIELVLISFILLIFPPANETSSAKLAY